MAGVKVQRTANEPAARAAQQAQRAAGADRTASMRLYAGLQFRQSTKSLRGRSNHASLADVTALLVDFFHPRN